jgi:hypothetical protein
MKAGGYPSELLQEEKDLTRGAVYHELLHCRISNDEDSKEVERDKAGRLKIYREDHDLKIKTFREEIKHLG